ncbi:MAG: hypothetical protein ABI439_11580 [Rhodospirillales bacterium]
MKGGIDILINNASGFGSTDDGAGWDAAVMVDRMASVRACQGADRKIGRRRDQSGAHQRAMTQAVLLASKKIRVNCVAPGSIEFPGGSHRGKA